MIDRRIPLLALLLPLAAAAARGDTDRLYVRGVVDVDGAVTELASVARRQRAPAVVVVFERITFAPPPGRNEYRYDHHYSGDLDAWLDALHRWADDTDVPLRVGVSDGPAPVRAGEAGWRETIRREVARPWWNEPDFAFGPALPWLRSWAPPGRRGRPSMLVLVASEMTPERWVEGGDTWRQRLLPEGTWWDPEAAIKALKRARCALHVVAPEVRFGDEHPLLTRPEPPWSARPQRPPPDLHGSWGSDEEQAYDQMLREDLERDLAAEIPDPAERKRVIDEILARPEDEGRTAPSEGGDAPDASPRPGAQGRFTAGTPALFPRWNGTLLFVNDVPSGYGWWPFARVAAESGGTYLLYPFGPSSFADRCPRDRRLLSRLAPDLGPLASFGGRIAGDRALDALARAAALVLDVTPSTENGTSGAWSAFRSVAPLGRAAGYRPRRRPSDPFLSGRANALEHEGRRLRRALTRYDEALRLLDNALARVASGVDRSAPRAVAHLTLGRFAFALSAFHLESLALCLEEIERYVPEGFDRRADEFSTTLLPAIRMSDCLEAYDGRTLPAVAEGHYPRALHRAWTPPGREDGPTRWAPGMVVPGQQGNVLTIAPEHPDYRARRDLDAVLKHLDERLKPRALDVVAAAHAVMERYARSPWGWTVYYTEALCYVFDPVDWGLDVRPRAGETSPQPDRPWTPRRPGSTPGGSVTPR